MSNGSDFPAWLLFGEEAPPWPASSKKKSAGFLEKTLDGVARVLKDEFFSQHLATQPGLMQNLDPRARVVTTAMLILLAALIRHPVVLFLLNVWVLWMARLSLVPLGLFLKRVWLFIPLFAGVIVLPTIFNFIRPGEPLLVLLHLPHLMCLGPLTIPRETAITKEGLSAALLLILRVGACVSLAALLTITTKWHVLLKALNVLFIPQIFVMVLEMTYRYIFVLLQITTDTFMARRSRTVAAGSLREKRRFVSRAIANLWARSYAMNEEVYAAMVARGYTGRIKTVARFQTTLPDLLWIGFVFLFSLLFYGGDHLLGN